MAKTSSIVAIVIIIISSIVSDSSWFPSNILFINALIPPSGGDYITILPGKHQQNQQQQQQHQMLPTSIVNSWPTWILSTTKTPTPPTIKTTKEQNFVFTKIPDDTNENYVNPFTFHELWQPIDLISPSISLCLGLHIRNGSIRHIMPALDITMKSGQKIYRNRGLCSIPRAHVWSELGIDVIHSMKNKSLTLWLFSKKTKQLNVDNKEEEEEEKWKLLSMVEDVGYGIDRAIESLANIDASTCDDEQQHQHSLGQGSHIVHVLLDDTSITTTKNAIQSPPPGRDLLAVLTSEKNIPYTNNDNNNVVDPMDDKSFPALAAALQVSIRPTAAGSESEFLPREYKELYDDETLRREEYMEWKAHVDQSKTKSTKKERSD